jgi:hypothetical protein
VLDDTCPKDPSAFWGLSSDLFPEKQRGDADGPAPCLGLPAAGVECGDRLAISADRTRTAAAGSRKAPRKRRKPHTGAHHTTPRRRAQRGDCCYA